ncbi:MAG: hypothetical protein WBA29_13065 [Xanthobacteraceae bacterium]
MVRWLPERHADILPTNRENHRSLRHDRGAGSRNRISITGVGHGQLRADTVRSSPAALTFWQSRRDTLRIHEPELLADAGQFRRRGVEECGMTRLAGLDSIAC